MSFSTLATSSTNFSMSTTTFDRLFSDVVEKIFGKLPIRDRVAMRLVCKSWRDRLVRSDFPVKPEPPWLILPIDSLDQPGNYVSNQITFESMSEERTYRFDLRYDPFPGYSWCCCGSSSDGGGWLLMAGKDLSSTRKSTKMILWDPISGTTKRLPALSTLPFFRELVDTCVRKEDKKNGLDIFSTPIVIARAQVFSVGSVECVVAVTFSGILNPNLSRLALCSPQEQSWRVVPYGPDHREYYRDVLFHNGRLYTIFRETMEDTLSRLPTGVRRSHDCTVGLSCCDVEVTKLEILYDDEHYLVGADDYDNNGIRKRWKVAEHLVGSSAGCGKGELLVVCAVLDLQEDPTDKPYARYLTGGFEVFGLDVDVNANNNNGICCLERKRNVGKQCIFVGATGSTLLTEAAAGDVDYGNVIHFATKDGDVVNWFDVSFVHERGVFDVARDTLARTYWKYLPYGTRSCVGWFTPKIR